MKRKFVLLSVATVLLFAVTPDGAFSKRKHNAKNNKVQLEELSLCLNLLSGR